MSEREASMLPLLAIGGLAIGAAVLLPGFLNKGESVDYELALEMARKLRKSDRRRKDLGMYPPDRDRIPLLMGGGGKHEDDAYIITDEDFSKLDIGRKDRSWLNKERKIRDARLERVVYGDSMSLPPSSTMQSFFVNTVSPYGQGPAHEFTRLNPPIDMSRTNTRTNTVNLY